MPQLALLELKEGMSYLNRGMISITQLGKASVRIWETQPIAQGQGVLSFPVTTLSAVFQILGWIHAEHMLFSYCD